MLDEGLKAILLWDQVPAHLAAFIPKVTLKSVESVTMYQGQFIYPGTLKVFFGYRLSDNTNATLVKNGIETGAATTTVSKGDTLAVKTRSATGAGNTVNLALQLGEKILPWSLTTASVKAGTEETEKMSGYTPVNGEVSESGGAVCQLPLTAPAGTSGMATNGNVRHGHDIVVEV